MFGKGLSKKIMPALFMFAKMHLNPPTPPHPTPPHQKKPTKKQETSETMYFGQIRPKWKCLAIEQPHN